ncbi:PQQ-binding-like beta-propeller repeat protein [Actinoplanes sp. NPDC049118]|uniref:PQQ-binding-like beta-propeller repeat protein n=1 Tax=Actinoplanes sp. NPDC049118 TaxID=3155769 RepID=UPI0033BFE889
MHARLSAAALLAAAMLSAPAAAAAAPATAQWAQPGYGAGNTYYNPGESVINAGSINSVKLRWTSALASSQEWSCSGPSEPLVSGDRVFVTDGTGIAAYQARTGRLSWRHTWANPEDESTPHLAVAGGLVLAANHGCQSQSDPNGAIMALNAVSGRQAWRTSTSIPLESLVVDEGTAVVSGASMSDTPQVIGFRVSDGRERWSLDDYRSSGVSAGGRLLIGSTSRVETRAVSTATGGTLWSKSVAWNAEAATPAGDRFYASGAGGAMICINPVNGSVIWTAAGRASNLIAADGRRVYRVITNGIEALHAGTGRRAWTAQFEGDTGQPVRAGGLLYTAVDAGEPLGIVNAANGKVASPGRQFGGMDGGNVVVAAGWIYLTRGESVFGYAL